jgi:uncharacterized SAM-binding protein YcdF (DUF218 family)
MEILKTIIFYLSKLLRPILFSPLTLMIVMVYWALIILKAQNRTQKIIKGISFCFVIVVTILSLPITVYFLAPMYEIPRSDIETAKTAGPYDAILVLGGMIDPIFSRPHNIEINDCFERLTSTAELYHEGTASLIIVSSGSGNIAYSDQKEAPFLAELLQRMGVPDPAIIQESESRNTHENIVYSKKILEDLHLSKILLVTSAWHLPRAIAICKKQGITVTPYSVDSLVEPLTLPIDLFPDAWALQRSTRLIREWIGVLAYRLLGRL